MIKYKHIITQNMIQDLALTIRASSLATRGVPTALLVPEEV